MPLNRSGPIAFAALVFGGCALLQPFETPVQTGTVDLFVDQAAFDGEELAARVLLRVRSGALSVQQHLRALHGLTVEDVTDCESGAPLPFLEFVVVNTGGPDPLVRVVDGHWFGVDTRFPIYDARFIDKPLPECIDVTIVWWMPHGEQEPSHPVSTTVRALTRRPDAGTPDAGAAVPGDAGLAP